MAGIIHYFLVVGLVITVQLACNVELTSNIEKLPEIRLLGNKDGFLTVDVIKSEPNKTTVLPVPSANTGNAAITTSKRLPSVITAFSTPPVPSAATATSSPGGNDASRIINLLFAILLVVTAILMAITGACMMGLRRRYLIVSEQTKYRHLEESPI